MAPRGDKRTDRPLTFLPTAPMGSFFQENTPLPIPVESLVLTS